MDLPPVPSPDETVPLALSSGALKRVRGRESKSADNLEGGDRFVRRGE